MTKIFDEGEKMTKKYKTKMEDSFKTKVQLFLFNKAFSWDNSDEKGCKDYYIKSNIETIKKILRALKSLMKWRIYTAVNTTS